MNSNNYTIKIAIQVPPSPNFPDGKIYDAALDMAYLSQSLTPPITIGKICKAVGLTAQDLMFIAFRESGIVEGTEEP